MPIQNMNFTVFDNFSQLENLFPKHAIFIKFDDFDPKPFRTVILHPWKQCLIRSDTPNDQNDPKLTILHKFDKHAKLTQITHSERNLHRLYHAVSEQKFDKPSKTLQNLQNDDFHCFLAKMVYSFDFSHPKPEHVLDPDPPGPWKQCWIRETPLDHPFTRPLYRISHVLLLFSMMEITQKHSKTSKMSLFILFQSVSNPFHECHDLPYVFV